jgi:hypothetical protein
LLGEKAETQIFVRPAVGFYRILGMPWIRPRAKYLPLFTSEGHIPSACGWVLFFVGDRVTIRTSLHSLVVTARPVLDHATACGEIDRLFHIDPFDWLQFTAL